MELIESIGEAFRKSREGDIAINTPFTASHLHEFIKEEFNLDFDTVRLRVVQFANIEFSVRSIIFRFSFNPGNPFSLFYRNMDSEKWHNAKFKETGNDLKHLTDLIEYFVFTHPVSPLDV